MSLNPACAGEQSAEHAFEYDHETTILYALGIGARQRELDYLYEARGPKVYPTFAVVPAYAAVLELLDRSGANLATLVHGAQIVRLRAPFPPRGHLTTTGRIAGVYDMKRLAQVVIHTTSRSGDTTLCETEWTLLLRGEGGFGGPRPPKTGAPRLPPDQDPVFEHVEQTSAEQALLYRLSGDKNPLHVDPDFAREAGFDRGPILHGLATFGFVARAVILNACDGDGDRLSRLAAQFRKPVWPGDRISTTGYRVGEQIVLDVAAGEESGVVTGCYAEVTRP